MLTVNQRPSPKELHKFGLAMFIGFAVVGTLLWCSQAMKMSDQTLLAWQGHGTQMAAVGAWMLGAALCMTALAPPAVARPVYVLWMTVTIRVGMVMSTIMLTVLFVLLLPIFSLVVRMGDPLRRKLKVDGSYWEDYKPYEATLERMRRLF